MGYCDNCKKCGFFYDTSRNDLCPKCQVLATEKDDLHEIAVKEAARDRNGGTSTGDWSPLSREDLDRCVDLAFIRGFKRGVTVNDNARAVIDALGKVTQEGAQKDG